MFTVTVTVIVAFGMTQTHSSSGDDVKKTVSSFGVYSVVRFWF